MARSTGWMLFAALLMCPACGDDSPAGGGAGGARGDGGHGGLADGGGGAAGSSGGAGGTGGAATPLIGEALEGNCPAGSKPPGTGVGPGNDLHKVTLTGHPEALCNDGSPPILYVRAAGTPQAANVWIVHLQPGGACGSYESCRDRWCSHQTSYDAAKMSSKFAPEATPGSGIFSRTPSNAFGQVNQVYVYYCSSDAWTGRRADVVLDDPGGTGPSFRLHFSGFSIIEAVADALEQGVASDDGVETLPSIGQATRILFSGSSAGSNGETHALDWWKARYPSAQVAGMLDSITDPLPEDVADPQIASTYEQFLQTQFDTVMQGLWDAHLDESCVAAHPGSEAHLCGSSGHVRLNHVTTPFFVRQDLTDPAHFSVSGFQAAGATIDQFADALHATMLRFADVQQTAEETIGVAPGVHVSNCGQHIVLLSNPWFGVAASGTNATVEDDVGAPTTLHDALGAWAQGAPFHAVDTQPSTTSICAQTTSDQ